MDAAARRLGTALVAAQFALMGALAALALLGWLGVGGGPLAPAAAGAVLALAAAVGVAAIGANRPGNFNIRPVPREGGRLVTHGPYRWVRHPMYTSVLLGGLAAVLLAPGAVGIAAAAGAWAALFAVLWVKSGVEERGLRAAHPGYAAYSKTVRRFVPWLL